MRVESARHIRYLGVAIVALGLLSIASPVLAQESSTTLRGVVTAEQDRAPLAGAAVTIAEIGTYGVHQ